MLKVIGIGDNVIEKYPEAKVMYPGGNILNYTVFSKRLGHSSAFLGSFASDIGAMHIKNVLMNLEIDISHCKSYNGRSRIAEVSISNSDRYFLNTPDDEKNAPNKVKLTPEDFEYIKKFDLIHTDFISATEVYLKELKAISPLISFDFSDKWTEDYLQKICPDIYLGFLSCAKLTEEEIEDVLAKAVSFGATLALAGMGSRGAMLYNGHRYFRRNAIDIQVIDPLGAGSAFVTSFFTEYIEKMKKENEDVMKVELSAQEDIIDEALSSAMFFSARICEQDGPFGYPMEIVEEQEEAAVSTIGKKLVIGVIGADVHAVGNKILEYAFTEAGFEVTNLGVMVSQQEFIDAAVETEADAIVVSSLYGHGEMDCRGIREKCTEAGLEDILLYIGGNLVVGVQDFTEVEKKYKEMGFNRVYPNTAPPEQDIADLKKDLGIEA